MRSILSSLLVLSACTAIPQSPTTSTREIGDCHRSPGVLRDTVALTSVQEGQGIGTYDPQQLPYLAGRSWATDGTYPVPFRGTSYFLFGWPIQATAPEDAPEPGEQVVRVGTYEGVPLFAHAQEMDRKFPRMLFLPVSPSCVFQPYWEASEVR